MNKMIWQAFNVKRAEHKAETIGMLDNKTRKSILKLMKDGLTSVFPHQREACIKLQRNSYMNTPSRGVKGLQSLKIGKTPEIR